MYDAIIVGARCAGSPTAMHLARAGYNVLVVDRATFPSDTLSTHYITPDGVERLRRWGLLDRILATGVPETYGVQRSMGGMTFPPMPGDPLGICPRRTLLDKIFVDAAREAGAEVREGVLVESLIEEDGKVVGVRCRKGDERFEERARVVIGADGRESFVARQVNAEAYDEVDGHCGGYYGYYKDFDGEKQELYLGNGYAIFVFRTNDDEACVGVEMTAANFASFRADIEGSIRAALATQPSVLERYEKATRSGKVMGLTPHKSFYRKPFGPGWALVGDAGYYRDPLLGQGINDALRDAEELSGALAGVFSGTAEWDAAMTAYQQQRDAATGPIYQLTALLTKELDPSPEVMAMMAGGPPPQQEPASAPA